MGCLSGTDPKGDRKGQGDLCTGKEGLTPAGWVFGWGTW